MTEIVDDEFERLEDFERDYVDAQKNYKSYLNSIERQKMDITKTVFTLSEVANATKLSPQYVFNLVDRYKVLSPDDSSGQYEFSVEHLKTAKRIAKLLERGLRIRDIVALIESGLTDEQLIELSMALRRSLLDSTSFNKIDFVRALEASHYLTRKESIVMQGVLRGDPLLKTAYEANLKKESETRKILETARAKVGDLTYILFVFSEDYHLGY